MIDYEIKIEKGIKWLCLKGRIDSITSPHIEYQITELTVSGDRIINIDFQEVNYISSAGLRVFFKFQRQLKEAGGEIILYGLNTNVLEIFKSGGFDNFFRIITSKDELLIEVPKIEKVPLPVRVERNDKVFNIVELNKHAGSIIPIGSISKLNKSQYEEQDVLSAEPAKIRFGLGLAALGDNFEEYKTFFGESIIINRNQYVYPAVTKPAVDFMLYNDQNSTTTYKFLNGIGFSGEFKYLLSFESVEKFSSITELVNDLLEITGSSILGVVILSEIKGLWGMNIKRVPITENQPQNGLDIFDQTNFAEWMNFPVEPSDINNTLIGVGIAVNDRNILSQQLQDYIPSESKFHLHGAVFEKMLLTKNIDEFEQTLNRISTELEIFKVQHLLGQTLLNQGFVGLIELEV